MNRIQVFLNLLQTLDSVEATVKVKGRNTVVPAGYIVEVPCKANIGNLSQAQPMIFQQEEPFSAFITMYLRSLSMFQFALH